MFKLVNVCKVINEVMKIRLHLGVSKERRMAVSAMDRSKLEILGSSHFPADCEMESGWN